MESGTPVTSQAAVDVAPDKLPHPCLSVSRSTSWQYADACTAENLPWWLMQTGSLTGFLRQRWGTEFRFLQLDQQWQPASTRSWRIVGGTRRPWVLARTVAMFLRQRLCIVARSEIPPAAMSGPLKRLRFLAHRPLGQVLQQAMDTRTEFQFARVRVAGGLALPTSCWARRSVLQCRGKPIPVMEVFLDPDMIDPTRI